jgi:hypothetical protein
MLETARNDIALMIVESFPQVARLVECQERICLWHEGRTWSLRQRILAFRHVL